MTRFTTPLAAVAAATLLLLTACATPSGSGGGPASDAPAGYSLGSLTPAPPEGEVIAQGTIMDIGGDVELCVGPIAESYPPQCRGIPVQGWSWDGVEGSDSSGDIRWGAYAVQGTYDGSTFSVTAPPMLLALYDPAPIVEPTDGRARTADPATLEAIQEELPTRLGAAYLASWPEEGHLVVQVLWDDGTWQKAADDDYGTGVVVIQSALKPIEP
jgi:hypothetical protein